MSESEDKDGPGLLDPNYVWSDRLQLRVRLLGGLQLQHATWIQPLLEAREAARMLRAASKAYPRGTTAQRPWTDTECARTDVFIPEDRLYDYAELVGPYVGFLVVEWDPRQAMPIIDRTAFVMAVICGLANDRRELLAEATQALSSGALLSGLRTTAKADNTHAISVGLHYEGNPSLQHLLLPASTSLSATQTLFHNNATLERLFLGAWTNIRFDLGPHTSGEGHTLQLPWRWLAITMLGEFDHTRGGHSILWDLGRVFEFPPGATILLPGILRYSFAKVQPGETRYLITQYAASPGTWVRWPAVTALFRKAHKLPSIRT
ncbi:hypothetical protein B0H17DRAFT_1154057 [Mycena rosella]|uniref:Uncharacterized protein n=1 Tax=Mycena rosella TaxID=1033263 RepID=A0AAD7F746_MYCRO|nr:hypothetical protein B0H17DRAFT_1154057 [Mycena rosella]